MRFPDDFTREGRSRRVKSLNHSVEIKMVHWLERWLLEENMVICRQCGGWQNIRESGAPFLGLHKAGCAFSDHVSQVPLGELAEILTGWHFILIDDE